MARVFISHASKDGEEAKRLLDWLCAQGFDGAFLDFDKHSGISSRLSRTRFIEMF